MKTSNKKINEMSKLSKSPLQTSGELDGETILMQMENGDYFGLGQVGSDIWQLLDETTVVSDLCDKLMETYEIGKDQCCEDVIVFLNKLEAEKLIVVHG